MNKKGILVIISGPSGSGKGTIMERVIADFKWVCVSVSATTRMPRKGEKDGLDYYFLPIDVFFHNIEIGNMIEYNKYCGNFYGTLKSELDRLLNNSDVVLVEVDVNGAEKIGKLMDCVKVFILPPSLKSLENRLGLRGTETKESLNRRLKEACVELEKAKFYDYLVENENIEDAVKEMKAILVAETRRIDRAGYKIAKFLKQ